jgi:hypothetical protein
MTSYASLPSGGTWTFPRHSPPVLRGTNRAEQLQAKPGEDSILIGRGGGDQLVGAKGVNIFKFEKLRDSSIRDQDIIFNFNPKEDKIDVSQLLKRHKVKMVRFRDDKPKEVGDVQLIRRPALQASTLNIKVSPTGPDFSVRIDSALLSHSNIKFFNQA